MLKFFPHNRPINYQPLLKFLFRLGYWGLIIAIFLSIWLFKEFSDGFLEGIEIGLKAFQFLREKCKNITPDYNATHTVFNGII
jgi:hypothetical protein